MPKLAWTDAPCRRKIISMSKLFFIKFFSFFTGCWLCFFLHSETLLSPVMASCLVGLLGSFLPTKTSEIKKIAQSGIYSGSFAGMCSANILTSPIEILILSLIGGLLFLISRKMFEGIGGKLGTIAFVSVALMYLIRDIL